MQFDRITYQARKIGMGGYSHSHTQRRIGCFARPGLTAHVMLAGGEENGVTAPFLPFPLDPAR